MKRLILFLLLLSVAAMPVLGQVQLRVGVDRDFSATWERLRTDFESASSARLSVVSYSRHSLASQISIQSFMPRDPVHFFMVPPGQAAFLATYLADLSGLRTELAKRGVSLVEVNRRPIGVAIPFAPDWILAVTSMPADAAAAVQFLAFVASYGKADAPTETAVGPTSVAQFATQKISRTDHNPLVDGALTALAAAADTALRAVSAQAVAALPLTARREIESLAGSFGVPFSSARAEVTVVLETQPGRTASTVSALSRLGVRQSSVGDASGLIKVTVPLAELGALAQQVSGVSFIRPPYTPFTLGTPTQGVGLIGADAFHTAGHRGSGTKIAVIDVGFGGLWQAQARGDLPYSVVTHDLTGTGMGTGLTHGTAVAEIVHDIAPDAQLYLIKIADDVDLDQAVTYCLGQGVHVINHSLGWFNTNFYDGTGTIAAIAQRAINGGIVWVNAAGNSAQRHWKGTFADANSDGWMDQSVTFSATAGEPIILFLTWNEWPNASTDYDLYLYAPGNVLIASSTKFQTGTEEPTESIQATATASGTYTVRIRGSGSRTLALFSMQHNLTPAVSASSIPAPGNVAGVVTVGAVGHAQYTTGPIEPYSSRGPTNDGRPKPDMVAPVNVATGTSPYTTFPGTSAAAPHAAGAAALLRSQTPGLSGASLRASLLAQTVPMGSANVFGNGRLRLQPTAPANVPPTASFTVSPSSGPVGTLFTFNGTASTDPDGTITQYAWEFGNGQTGAGAIVSHVYASPGTYTARLTVTDNQGATGTTTRTVVVQAVVAKPDLVVSSLTASPSHPSLGQTLVFSITITNQGNAPAGSFRVRLSGASLTTYGTVSPLAAGASQMITLTLPLTQSTETYTATADDLNQVDESNETNNTRSLTVTAAVTPVVANAGGPYSGIVGSAIAFNGTASSGPITSYVWTFGDGTTRTGATPSHTYASPGTYTVALTVSGSGGQTSTATTQAVVSPAAPQLSAQLWLPKSTYQVGESISITYTVNRAAYVYLCDVTPDGRVTLLFPNWQQPSALVGPGSHTFPSGFNVQVAEPVGTETLYLFAATGPITGFPTSFGFGFPLLSTNPTAFRNQILSTMASQYAAQDRAHDTRTFNIVPATPTTGSIQVTSSPSGAQVRIDGTLVGTTPHLQPNVTPGVRTVQISRSGYQTETRTVNVVAGQTSNVSVTLTAIPSNLPPIASFVFSPSNPKAGDSVSFNASASSDPDGAITSYAWTFGDGTTGTGVSPSHTFVSSGTYTVRLTVTDNLGATNAVTRTVTVAASPAVGWVSPVGHSGSGATWRNPERAYNYDADRGFRSSSIHDSIDGGAWSANLILHAPSGGIQSNRIRLLVGDTAPQQNVLAWVVDVHRDGAWVNVYTGSIGSLPEHRAGNREPNWVEIGFDQGLVTHVRLRAHAPSSWGTNALVFEVMFRDATVAPP